MALDPFAYALRLPDRKCLLIVIAEGQNIWASNMTNRFVSSASFGRFFFTAATESFQTKPPKLHQRTLLKVSVRKSVLTPTTTATTAVAISAEHSQPLHARHWEYVRKRAKAANVLDRCGGFMLPRQCACSQAGATRLPKVVGGAGQEADRTAKGRPRLWRSRDSQRASRASSVLRPR